MTAKCPICGEMFESNEGGPGRRKIYCSVSCRNKNGAKKRTVSCPNCGKMFDTFGTLRKYCSSECCKEYTLKMARDARAKRKAEKEQRYCELCGAPIKKTSRRKKYCSDECMEAGNYGYESLESYRERSTDRIDTEEQASEMLQRVYPFREYLGGYTKREEPITVRDLRCGHTYEISGRCIRDNRPGRYEECPICMAEERERIAQEKAEEQAQIRAFKKERANVIKTLRRICKQKEDLLSRTSQCAICGAEYIKRNGRTCCSDECRKVAKRIQANSHNHRRRQREQKGKCESNLAWRSIWRAERGTCWICGKKCNTKDWTTQGGLFIAGDWYPSLDHVIPLALGGTHTRDNVRLAHRICNSRRGVTAENEQIRQISRSAASGAKGE